MEDRGVCRARFIGVLHGQHRPAVLIEAGFLSNPSDARQIEKAGVPAEAGPGRRGRFAVKAGNRKSEIGGRRSEIGDRKSEGGNRHPESGTNKLSWP